MRRREFLRRAAAAVVLAEGTRAGGTRGGRSRRSGWSVRLDDPALGGRGDGTTLNDAPFLQALSDMPASGGTIVIPPDGPWLFDAVDLARVPRRGVTVDATGARLVKSPRTATHMFRDEAGQTPDLRVVGATFEMSAASFAPGQTVSAFFLVRPERPSFVDVTVRDGIEEGLKLYKPRGLLVHGGRFERLANDGIQVHVPAADGFRGDAEDHGAEDVAIEGATFVAVDDGLHGMEGQGVSVSSASPRLTARGVRVVGCTFERCVRGAWAEFNQPDNPGVAIAFERNTVIAAECHGLGLVGVRGGALRGNRILDTGRMIPGTPGTAASEIAGIVVSGSPRTPGSDVVIEDNEIAERRRPADARMQYGILVRRQERLTMRRNAIRGATVRDVANG